VQAVKDSPLLEDRPVVEQAGELRSARIESLRAVAALAVFVGHVFGQANDYDPARTLSTFADRTLLGGGFGVYLFFALSGYLLFLPFARRDYDGGPAVDYRRYAQNRVVRILPLYFAVVIVLLLATESGGSAKQWLTWLTFSENFTSDRSLLTDVNGVMWSLVIEVHFYILLPFIAFALARLARGSLGRVALVLGALGLASFVLRYVTLYDDSGPVDPLVDYSLPSTFTFFVAGMVVVLARIAWERRPPRFVTGSLAWAETWIAASVVFWLLVFDDYSRGYLAAVASALLLAACVMPLRAGPVVRLLEWKVLAFVGVVSYSFYMWHLPLLEQLGQTSWDPDSFSGLLLLSLPICLAIAILSYRFIEAPFLRLRRRWGATAAQTAASEEQPARREAAAH
jgi:peptidoglycan/LPS O-acetylase OafA/YrhL